MSQGAGMLAMGGGFLGVLALKGSGAVFSGLGCAGCTGWATLALCAEPITVMRTGANIPERTGGGTQTIPGVMDTTSLRYDQIAHDQTCDAWSMDRTFTVFVEHNLVRAEEGDFEIRAQSRDAIAYGRVDPVRQIGSVMVNDGWALQPVLDRICIAFPQICWYAFEQQGVEGTLSAA